MGVRYMRGSGECVSVCGSFVLTVILWFIGDFQGKRIEESIFLYNFAMPQLINPLLNTKFDLPFVDSFAIAQ